MSAIQSTRALTIVEHQQGNKKVKAKHSAEVRKAIRELPFKDRLLLWKNGVRIEMMPSASLGQSMIGAADIVKNSETGLWKPTRIRIATRAGEDGSVTLEHIVKHEIGHAIAVLRKQDRSEDAAEAYARKHM